MEESKSYRGEGGGRGCPTDMPVDAVLEGVQSEVARILKADATAIPTVRPRREMGGVADGARVEILGFVFASVEVCHLFRLPTLMVHRWQRVKVIFHVSARLVLSLYLLDRIDSSCVLLLGNQIEPSDISMTI